MIKAIYIIMIFMLCSCGAANGGGGGSATNKNLFSIWTRTDLAISLDLRSESLATPATFAVTFSSGATCSCTATMTGTQSAGNYSLAGCAYVSGGSGDPGCAGLDETGTFTKSALVLNLCDPTCGVYN